MLLPTKESQAEPAARPQNSCSGPIFYDRCCLSHDFQFTSLRTVFHHCGKGAVGSCSGILCCVQLHSEENFLLLWKILLLCITNLAKSLNMNISSEMEARRTPWLSKYKIQRLIGSSLAFFINTFCRMMAYKQLKWKTIYRDCNFIKEQTNKQASKQMHSTPISVGETEAQSTVGFILTRIS